VKKATYNILPETEETLKSLGEQIKLARLRRDLKEKIHTARCGEIHYWITEKIDNTILTLLFLPGLTADHRLIENILK